MGSSFYLVNPSGKIRRKIGHRVNRNFFWEIEFDELVKKMSDGYHILEEDEDIHISFKNFIFLCINGCRHVTHEEYREWETTHPGECYPPHNK